MIRMAPWKGKNMKDIFDDRTQLRFLTCGSVDDGKSTLIGRLLYDTGNILSDQMEALENESRKKGTLHGNSGELDFSLLLDGLLAEREQGITIDVAYRYFSSGKRKFIVADTPGHSQYTRNMATGASNAELAVILIDARNGILQQTKRHTYIVSLMGISHIILCVNKMDLIKWSRDVFNSIACDYMEFCSKLSDRPNIYCVPVSAKQGDNVFSKSLNMSWYDGNTLTELLDSINPLSGMEKKTLRFPVQWVNRPNLDFRGYSGTVMSGSISKDDTITVLPSGITSTVKSIVTYDGEKETASAGESVTITVKDEVDISRGDILSHHDDQPEMADQFRVTLVWMEETPLMPGRGYFIKIGTKTVSARITNIRYKINIDTMEHEACDRLEINDIGICNIALDTFIPFDPYEKCHATGGFIVIDKMTCMTAGTGIIHFALRRSENLSWHEFDMNKTLRGEQKNQKPCVLWFTGLSASGKSTIANIVDKKLFAMGFHSYILDGDNIRMGLNKDLGFTPEARVENIRRVSEVAKLFTDAGLIVMVSFISPYRSERDYARSIFASEEFIEIHVDTPLEVCEQRDPKNLYKKARLGNIPNFTGINAPYEPPEKPEIHLDGINQPESLADTVIDFLLKTKRI